MNTRKAFGLILIWCVSVTLLSARQFNLEFSVVGTGGGVSSVGSDTLILTVGQPLVGDGSVDSSFNSSGFLYQYGGGPIGSDLGIYSVINGWNMVSVPRTVNDYRKSILYPMATTKAFAYAGAYQVRDTLNNGFGYWLKFNGAQSLSMSGSIRNADTVNVNTGWNMIGSISQSIPVAQVTSIPGGITTSQFWHYQGSYSLSNMIEPGKAYWVKAKQPGKLVLASSSTTASASSRISIVPGAERPPSAPDGEVTNLSERVLSDKSQIPNQFALEQNYPNPFNPTTEIRYALRDAGFVTLKIYDVLGKEVATLVNEMQSAGYKSITWDARQRNGGQASEVPTGVYFYRLTAGGFADTKTMLLLR